MLSTDPGSPALPISPLAAAGRIDRASLLCAGAVPAQAEEPDRQLARSEERVDAMKVVAPVLDRLDAAWNAASGADFAAEFSEDADIVNIFGEPYRGRADMARRMQFVFDGIFRNSTHLERDLEIARYLSDDTILAVSSTRIAVPSGPLSPETRNRQTFVLVRDGERWVIRHWHNTTITGDPA